MLKSTREIYSPPTNYNGNRDELEIYQQSVYIEVHLNSLTNLKTFKVRIVWLRKGNCPRIQIGSRLDRRADQRVRLTGARGIAEQEFLIVKQEFLQFLDCFYIRFQIRFCISSYEVADR